MALTFGGATSNHVDITAYTSSPTAFTAIMWHFPTTQTGLRRLWSKINAGETSTIDVQWRFGDANDIEFEVPRATASAVLITNTGFATNTWHCHAFTYDESDGNRIFYGTLTTAMAEAGYASRSAGSGATNTHDDNLRIGNFAGGASSTVSYQGRIAFFQFMEERLTLGQIQALQHKSRVVANTKILMHLGFNGTGTQPDWSGNGNSGSVNGATVGSHVPLGNPFGADSGWMGAFTAAAAASVSRLVGRIPVGRGLAGGGIVG